jgi:hypothetical protein
MLYGSGAVLHTDCLLEPTAAAAAWLSPLGAVVIHLGRALPPPRPRPAKRGAVGGAGGGGVVAERSQRAKGQEGPRRAKKRAGRGTTAANEPIWLSPVFNHPCPCGKVWATGGRALVARQRWC